jgi:hypothetical protein
VNLRNHRSEKNLQAQFMTDFSGSGILLELEEEKETMESEFREAVYLNSFSVLILDGFCLQINTNTLWTWSTGKFP